MDVVRKDVCSIIFINCSPSQKIFLDFFPFNFKFSRFSKM